MDGEGYRAIDEGIELAKLIVAAGADALHVDAGCHENWPNAMPPAGMQQMTLQSRSAKIIRSVVDVPVMTHGRFGDVDKAEAALRDGVCDIAVIGRGLLADPDLPNKVLAGRPDTIRPCISCNEGCIARVYNGETATCALNPRCGHEDGSIDIPPAAHPKRFSSSAPALPAAWRRSMPNRPAIRSRSGRRAATSVATLCAPASRFSSATCTA